MRHRLRGAAKRAFPPLAAVAVLAILSGCAHRPTGNEQPQSGSASFARPGTARVAANPNDIHVPDFARKPYEPFSRIDAVAIAEREWRLFGQRVDDDPPDTRPPPLPEDKPERMPGLWQRVGEYWFEGMDAAAKESAWTGKHDEWGLQFPAPDDGTYAWSAAFISYVMRIAGAGDRFPYSSVHADYINLARGVTDSNPMWVVQAQPPAAYAPRLGDLICTSRALRRPIRFEDLPTSTMFPSHCDIVVNVAPGVLTVIGGNVDDAVTMKHVPITPDGMLATSDGMVMDTRYPWFVVLRVLYDR